MSQFIKRREMIILGILGVALYAFVYVRFVIFPALPQIEEKQSKIISQLMQKSSLDNDLANLASKKAEYKIKSLNNEHMGEYMMDTAGVTDGLEYIEKISRMMRKEITSVNVNAPKEIIAAAASTAGASGGAVTGTAASSADSAGTTANAVAANNTTAANNAPPRYYEFRVDFKTTLTYNEAMELARYCEGGARKIRISNFRLSAASAANNANEKNNQNAASPAAKGAVQAKPAAQANGGGVQTTNAAVSQAQANDFLMADNSQKFDVSMSISFYSINKGNVDKLYDYSQSRFQKFKDSSGVPIIQEKKDSTGNIILPDIASSENGAEKTAAAADDGKITLASADLVINEVGYLVGGENFEMFCHSNTNDRIRIKTKEFINIYLRLHEGAYSIDAAADDGVVNSLGGSLDKNTFTIYINSKIPYAKENMNLGFAIRISNLTDKSVNVAMAQRTDRVRLLDRIGNEVFLKSDSEKVYIV